MTSDEGTPAARFDLLMNALEKRFPGAVNPYAAAPPELKLLEAIDKLLEGMEPLSGLHSTPDACPTYYDGCHCTVGTLAHNVERAQKAEAQVKELGLAEKTWRGRAKAHAAERDALCSQLEATQRLYERERGEAAKAQEVLRSLRSQRDAAERKLREVEALTGELTPEVWVRLSDVQGYVRCGEAAALLRVKQS